MIKIMTTLILALGLVGFALLINDGLRAIGPTHGIVLDNGDVVIFYGGKTRRCGFYSGDLVACGSWSN